MLNTATRIIADDGNARTAPKALKILSDKVKLLQDAVAAEKRQKKTEDFMFTYEEEADPEVFFVPYVWEVIVCVLTASSIEWQKDRIQVFAVAKAPAIEHDDATVSGDGTGANTSPTENGHQSNGYHFAKDASDVV